MMSDFVVLALVGAILALTTARGAQLSVNLDQWALSGAIVSAFGAILCGSYGWEKGLLLCALVFGMMIVFSWKILRLRRRAPASFSGEGGRAGELKDVFGGPDGWEVVHSDGSRVSYDNHGRVTAMTFSDGGTLDLT